MPFKKGDKNINKNGRPRGSGLKLTSLLKSELEKVPEGQKKTYSQLFINKLLQKGLIEGDFNTLKLIINYVDGLPKGEIDLNNKIRLSVEDRYHAEEAIKEYLNDNTGNTTGGQ